MVRGFKLMRHILQQPALAQFGGRELAATAGAQTDAEIEQAIRNLADTIYHPVGSCRMGPGDMDVVDAELRVHGLQGLRVVDASIMPQHCERQHQCAGDHDRRKGRRHDQGIGPLTASGLLHPITPMNYQAKPARYDTMPYRFCGKSGLKLPAISLGLWHNFGDATPLASPARDAAHRV